MNEQLDKRTVVAASRVKYNDGYMPGFGNDFETEALPGALPVLNPRAGEVIELAAFLAP